MNVRKADWSTLASIEILTRADYLERVQYLLAKTFASDSVGWNFVDRGRGAVALYGDPPELYENHLVARLLIELEDHPVVNSYLSELPQAGLPAPRRLVEVTSRHDFQKTRTYAELFKPFGVQDQLTIVTARPDSGSGSCWTINREHGRFSSAEVEIARSLQPFLAMTDAIWSNIGTLERRDESRLTPREVQILTLLSTGAKSSSVAHHLGIALPTVTKHIEHIYRKLGCSDRVSAVGIARATHLIPLFPSA